MPNVRLEDVPESDRLYEIVNGKKVWLPLRSVYACFVAHNLVERLYDYSEGWTRGHCYINMPYEVPVGGNTVRRPSGSFVSAERLRARGRIDPRKEGNPVAPELVIEVQGADDFAETTLGKVHEYQFAGVSLVWVVYPLLRCVHAFSSPTRIRVFTETDILDAGDVLPGFSVAMPDLFPPVDLSAE
jgi:Uma2 family endonuclease